MRRHVRSTIALVTLGCLVATSAPVLAGTVSYSYDRLGRMTQAVYPNGAIIRFNYDANGNRTSYVVTGSGNPPPAGTPVADKTVQPTSVSSAN